MTDKLTQFILETSGEPWRFGHSDCAPWVARWVTRATGRRVPIPVYDDIAGSVRVVREAGGLKPLFMDIADRVGLKTCLFPERGDIALMRHPQAMQMQVLSVCLGGGKWAAKVSQTAQVATFSGVPVIAWKIEW